MAPSPPTSSTSSHTYDCVEFHKDLPILLFLQKPGPDPFENIRKVPALANDAGTICKNVNGNVLRYFSFLPRCIDTSIDGFVVEFWRRLDSRLKTTDLVDRMTLGAEITKGIRLSDANKENMKNILNTRAGRARQALDAYAWKRSCSGPTKVDFEIEERATEDQVFFNTAMKVVGGVLLKPQLAQVEKRMAGYMSIVGYMSTDLPIDFFVKAAADENEEVEEESEDESTFDGDPASSKAGLPAHQVFLGPRTPTHAELDHFHTRLGGNSFVVFDSKIGRWVGRRMLENSSA